MDKPKKLMKKKIVQIISLSIFFIGCKKNDQEISGLWIGSSVYDNDVFDYGFLDTPIVFITSDTIEGYIIDENPKELEFFKKKIVKNNNGFKVADLDQDVSYFKYGSDSTEAMFKSYPRRTMRFYKIFKEGVVKESFLLNKKFKLLSEGKQKFNLNFVNDSTCSLYSIDTGIKKNIIWKKVDLNNYSFLILYDSIGPMVFHLYQKPNNIKEIEMREHSNSRPQYHMVLDN